MTSKFTLKQIARFLDVDYETLSKQVRGGGVGPDYLHIGKGRVLQFDEVETVCVFAMSITMRHLRNLKMAEDNAACARKAAGLPEMEMQTYALNFWLWQASGKKQETAQQERNTRGERAKEGIEYRKDSYCLIRYPIWLLIEMVGELQKQVARELKEKVAAKRVKKEVAPAKTA